jgi:hypothetical protein
MKKPNSVYSCGNCIKVEASLKLAKAQIGRITRWSDAQHAELEKRKERVTQLEAELSGLESCCRVLEKALGVRKGADLKEIEARAKKIDSMAEKPKSRYLGYSNHEIGRELEVISNVLGYRGFVKQEAELRHIASELK